MDLNFFSLRSTYSGHCRNTRRPRASNTQQKFSFLNVIETLAESVLYIHE